MSENEEQAVDKYPYSDTVAELQKISALLEQVVQQLSGLVPRFYVEMPDIVTARDKKLANEIRDAVQKFFGECPAGGVKAVSAKEALFLSRYLKKIG